MITSLEAIMLRSLTVLSAFLLGSATALAAQEIRGTVTEAGSERPLEATLLTVTTLDQAVIVTALTDSTGHFVLPVPAGDSVRLQVERMDYEPLESVPIALEEGEPLQLEIRLRPRPLDVGEIRAVTRRQRSGFGWYLDERDLTDNPPSTATWAMLRMPYVIQAGRGIRVLGGEARPRNAWIEGSVCEPTIYVDGSFHDVPADQLDSWVSGPSIRAVELYRDRNHAPPKYVLPGRENCAIVLIWTDHAFGSEGPSEWPWSVENRGSD